MNYEEARQIGPDGPNPGKWKRSDMTRLREAIMASANDISRWGEYGWESLLDPAEARIRRAIEDNIDDVALSEESLSDPNDPWAAGFRSGWQAAREAVGR